MGTVSNLNVTAAACEFIESARLSDMPDEAIRIAKRCMLDGLALYVAGSVEPSARILAEEAVVTGGREDALILGKGEAKAPAPAAARVLGTAGHAHDWDDTQVSRDPRHQYGLLTHPTIPPLAASLVVAQMRGDVGGEEFMTAFLTGFEVECKISEIMLPDHYKQGFHSSGTVGTFGACAAAAKLLGLAGEKLGSAMGIAASMASGIRINFGTMTKPLHVGRASENGVTAALLAARGFTADGCALDGPWGFFSVHGGGLHEEKVADGFGKTYSIVEPGVSIKPYPSGILTHQAMDAMLRLVREHDVGADGVERITLYAGSNILKPIRYAKARNHLEAKFSMAALLAMLVIRRRAGRAEFTDEFVASPQMQAMQERISTALDPEIEAKGMDIIRSRIELVTRAGETHLQWADERYRGGPDNPMSDAELEEKVAACTDGVIDDAATARLIETAWRAEKLTDAADLARVIQH
ncbi:MAG: MmgE/PrpD family protein [Proteobacteria bacterium]|nr:MmgE/PrpD family protein [Pseudomonadota bacterium]